MTIYELTHVYYRFNRELIYSPKLLGFFDSLQSVTEALQYYCIQPGFCDNSDTFSVRPREVMGTVTSSLVYEAGIYFHSENYDHENCIELGLFGTEAPAQKALSDYCYRNKALITLPGLVVEKYVNKCVLGRYEWPEGFVVDMNK